MKKSSLPPRVKETMERLKRESKSYIEAKYRKGNSYYIFEATSRLDESKRKPVKITRYIGRIMGDGIFVEAKHRNEDFMERLLRFLPELVKKELSAIRRVHGSARIERIEEGKFYVYEDEAGRKRLMGAITENGYFEAVREEAQIGEVPSATKTDEALITALSMNSRLPFSKLGTLSGVSEQTAYSRTKSLEKRFGIRYVLELDIRKLRFMPFIILIKFIGDIPPINDLAEFFAKEPKIQFAAMTSGAYDVIAYMLEEDNYSAGFAIWKLRNQAHMRNYRAVWYISPYSETYGFMPLRDEFIDKVLSKKEWTRSKEKPAPSEGELLKRELILIREMNNDAGADLTSIDAKNSLTRGSSQYTYHKLLEKGIIKRPTIKMEGLPIKYNCVILGVFNNVSDYDDTRMKLLREFVVSAGAYNRFSVVGDMGVPNGGLGIYAVLDYEESGALLDRIKMSVKGIEFSNLVITNIMVGSLCYRRFDMTYTTQYPKLVERKEIEPVQSRSYE